MMRSVPCLTVLALYLFALQCTADTDGDSSHTDSNSRPPPLPPPPPSPPTPSLLGEDNARGSGSSGGARSSSGNPADATGEGLLLSGASDAGTGKTGDSGILPGSTAGSSGLDGGGVGAGSKTSVDTSSVSTVSDPVVTPETTTTTEAASSVPKDGLPSLPSTTITVTDTGANAANKVGESGVQLSAKKTPEVVTEPKPSTTKDTDPKREQGHSPTSGTTNTREISSSRETSLTKATGAEGSARETLNAQPDATRIISGTQNVPDTTARKDQPAKPENMQGTLQSPQTPFLSTARVPPPAPTSTAHTTATNTGHNAVGKTLTAQGTATASSTQPKSPVKGLSPTTAVAADNSATPKKTASTDNVAGPSLTQATSNAEGKDKIPVQTLTSNTSTAAPTTSTNTSENSKSKSDNTDSTAAAISLPKLSKALQNVDLKDGSIDRSLFGALTALITLSVMAVVPMY